MEAPGLVDLWQTHRCTSFDCRPSPEWDLALRPDQDGDFVGVPCHLMPDMAAELLHLVEIVERQADCNWVVDQEIVAKERTSEKFSLAFGDILLASVNLIFKGVANTI
jgi:hypothetical protein